MAKFKVGDLVRGRYESAYSITNHNTTKAKVVKIIDDDYIKIEILEHKFTEYHGEIYPVLAKYFDKIGEENSIENEIKNEYPFKVGEIVKGISDSYGVTNTNMTQGKITKINLDGKLSILVLEHSTRRNVVGMTFTDLDPKDFKKVFATKDVSNMTHKFKVGDIVKGKYRSVDTWADVDMTKGQVTKVSDDGNLISVKILEHNGGDSWVSPVGRICVNLPAINYDLVEGSPFIIVSDLKIGKSADLSKIIGGGSAPRKAEQPKEIDYDNLESLKKLNDLTGLEGVKRTIKEMVANVRVSKIREKAGLKNTQHSLHMAFKGNPGTGKTTVARIAGEIMVEIGALKKSSDGSIPFVELIHADVESMWVGEADKNIKKKFDQAKGGVLFIDEAYSFVGTHQTKTDMVTTIVKLMEDMRDEVLVIAAGYDEDIEKFLSFNTGLRSRFTNTVHFEDYKMDELILISEYFCKDMDYTMSAGFSEKLKTVLEIEGKMKHFGNARTVRNIIEKAIRVQSNRVLGIQEPTREQLMELVAEDIVYDETYARQLMKNSGDKVVGFTA
jgi:stage V sporulation protein K